MAAIVPAATSFVGRITAFLFDLGRATDERLAGELLRRTDEGEHSRQGRVA